MNIMALYSLPKINRKVIQNSRRLFSFKFEMTPRLGQETTSTAEEAVPAALPEEQPNTNFRYNVCQPRTSPVDRPSTAGDVVATQRQIVRHTIEQQHLQPSMLPEYYQRRMERSPYAGNDPEPNEENRINKGHSAISERRFQVSKTHANATFPLKSVKLANPFPEPVKMMMSRTVADDEKAEQMLAESRSQRSFSDWGKTTPGGQRTMMTEIRRWFSSEVGTDPSKCKKMGKNKKSCPNLSAPCCPPRSRFSCQLQPKDRNCKKQEAPYPAYSEFCHEDIDEKPSECKLCPWTPEGNPNFKQKKKMHTSAHPLQVKRTGLEVDWNEYNKKVEEEAYFTPIPKGEDLFVEDDEMLCDMRKPDCERPNISHCPPGSQKKKEKAVEKKEDKCKKPCKKASTNDLADILGEEQTEGAMILKKCPSKSKCKVKKIKFPKCGETVKRRHNTGARCPPKERKQYPDCPPLPKDCQGIENDIEIQDVRQMRLSDDKVRKDKQKCPHVDMTVNTCDFEDDEPCPKKNKESSRRCPGDLLKKKRWKPKKKTFGVITPKVDKVDPKQPSLTVKPPM